MIRVLFYAGIRERAGASESRVDGFAGTLAELLKHLEERHGISLTAPSQSVQPARQKCSGPLSDMIFMINGRHIAHIGGFDAPVSDGDVVSIFPIVDGG